MNRMGDTDDEQAARDRAMADIQQAYADKAAGKEPEIVGPGSDGYGGSPFYAMLKKDGLSVESKLAKLDAMPGTNVDLKDAMRAKLTRQQRRASSRAEAKMAENAQRVALANAEEQAKKLARMRYMLFALVRREGRVRLTQAELNATEPTAGLDVKVQENGDLLVTYVRGRDR